MTTSGDLKQWEIRAALRAMARSRETSSRPSPAEALVAAASEIIRESDDFTLKQVSQRSGVALETLYRHFASKDELVLAVLEHTVVDSVERIVKEVGDTEDPVGRLELLVLAPFRLPVHPERRRTVAWRARERQRLLARFPREVESGSDAYLAAITDALTSARDAGLIDTDDVELDALLIQQQVRTTYYELHARGFNFGPERVGRRVWEYVSRGLALGRRHAVS